MSNNNQEKGSSKNPDDVETYPFLEKKKDRSIESLPDAYFVKQVYNQLLKKFPQNVIVATDLGSGGWQIKVEEAVIHIGVRALNTDMGAQNLNLRPTIKKSDFNQYPWLNEILHSIATEVVFID
jgi:hypothetical protein